MPTLQELKHELMRRMRAERIPDASIARVLEVSRQAVGQLLGPAGPVIDERRQAEVERIRGLIADGLTLEEIAIQLDRSYQYTWNLTKRYLAAEWGAAKGQRGFRRTEALMRAAYAELGPDFTWSDLLRYDRKLPNRSRRYMTFAEWKEYLCSK